MSIDLSGIMTKATKLAERATTEDQAGNNEVAREAYLAAAEWLIHATKYGALNDQMKKNVRAKVDSYLKRAEALQTVPNRSAAAAPAAGTPIAASNTNGQRRATEDADVTNAMEKFKENIVKNSNVTFDNVVGLEQAKTALKEAVILPIKFPRLFRDERKPWSGILLYGPPGTGKSFLAKATATECNSTFISVTAANILSHWVGVGEKNVRSLFELARAQRPCVIFIDELDALCGQRTDTGNEATQRVLNEFLTQMDGVGNDNKGILVLGATNLPWSLDMAMRRRLQKRIYIPLPELNERQSMFRMHLGTSIPNTIKADEWIQLGQKSENYSGSDIAVVCREALLRPIRRLTSATHFKRVPNPNPQPDEPTHLWLVCSPGDSGAQEMTIKQINPDELYEPPVTMSDMLAALAVQRATVNEEALTKYRKFTGEFGQEGI